MMRVSMIIANGIVCVMQLRQILRSNGYCAVAAGNIQNILWLA